MAFVRIAYLDASRVIAPQAATDLRLDEPTTIIELRARSWYIKLYGDTCKAWGTAKQSRGRVP